MCQSMKFWSKSTSLMRPPPKIENCKYFCQCLVRKKLANIWIRSSANRPLNSQFQGKTALTSLATFASCLFIHSERFCDYSIVWTAQFLMASQQKLLNADRLQTVLFSTRFVTWERENQFAIFDVIWISFSAWSTDDKRFIYNNSIFFLF